jgi:hypothetical protein
LSWRIARELFLWSRNGKGENGSSLLSLRRLSQLLREKGTDWKNHLFCAITPTSHPLDLHDQGCHLDDLQDTFFPLTFVLTLYVVIKFGLAHSDPVGDDALECALLHQHLDPLQKMLLLQTKKEAKEEKEDACE